MAASDAHPASANPGPPAVAVRVVSKRIGDVIVLDELTLEVPRGTSAALLGSNGVGKTTLVNLIAGLRRPDRGQVEIFGRDPRDWRARRRLGVVPQEIGFLPHLRVREVIDLVRAHHAHPVAAADLLARFALDSVARREAGRLSPGQRRRLAVALAFAGRPDLLVLDEPTAGLDAEARRIVWDELRRYARSGGTLLLTTHHLDEAKALADTIVVLARGQVRAYGPRSVLGAAIAPSGASESGRDAVGELRRAEMEAAETETTDTETTETETTETGTTETETGTTETAQQAAETPAPGRISAS